MKRWLACAALLAGCNTAAQFDVEPEEVASLTAVGAQGACAGEGHQLAIVLQNQYGGAVRVGGRRLRALPGGAAGAFVIEDAFVDGATATVTVTRVEAAQAPRGVAFAAVLQRDGVACGALPTGPWPARCNAAPCGDGAEACDPARGCCAAGAVCTARIAGDSLAQVCATPGDGCAEDCGADAVCVDGACRARLFGPVDAEDDLVQSFAGTAAVLLDPVGGRLGPGVPELTAWAASDAGLQALTELPATTFDPLGAALEGSLLPPYGAPGLLDALARAPGDAPTVVWALRAGPPADLTGRAPHFFAVPEHAAITAADDRAFAAAACATGGGYGRLPTDVVEPLANGPIAAAAQAHLRLHVRIEPPPAPGARLRALLRLDVPALVGSSPAPPVATLEHRVDLIVGGTP